MKGLHTYLTFDGNCRQAMEFYAKCIGADVRMMTFSEAPMDAPPTAKDRIMHARLAKGDVVLMASDSMPGMPLQQGNNFSLAFTCENVAEAEKLFAALGDKGKVTMPLQETFWAQRFGMIMDQFGVQWMINLEKAGH